MRNNEVKSIGAGVEIGTHDIYIGNLILAFKDELKNLRY